MTNVDRSVCLTIDVEWAHRDVLAEMIEALDERGLRATFFCTHAGIDVGEHERAIHPNFRWSGDSVRKTGGRSLIADLDEDELNADVVRETLSFCPDAVGARAHYLRSDTSVFRAYVSAGLAYDSSYLALFEADLAPRELPFGLIEMPIYYMDHFDIINGLTGFQSSDLRLDGGGMKVLDFHPNMVFSNAPSEAFYQGLRAQYHDPPALAANRFEGRGIRDFFYDVLDELAVASYPVVTLKERAIGGEWRAAKDR
jgi:hypothetical protein